jgi:hypothetical protein
MRLPMVSERFFSAFTPFGYVLDRPVIVSAKGTVLRFQMFYHTIAEARGAGASACQPSDFNIPPRVTGIFR